MTTAKNVVCLLLLGMAACKHSDAPQTRALDLATQSSTAWPAGTTILLGDKVVEQAAIDGDQLFIATRDQLFRVPKTGGPPTRLSDFAMPGGYRVVDLFVVEDRVFVYAKALGESREPVRLPPRLFTVPINGAFTSEPTPTLTPVDFGERQPYKLTKGLKSIWLVHSDGSANAQMVVEQRPLASLDTPKVIAKAAWIAGFASDATGAVWLEGCVGDRAPCAVVSADNAGNVRRAAAKAPLQWVGVESFHVTLDVGVIYVASLTPSSSALRSTGPFGSASSVIYAIDRQTGETRTVIENVELSGEMAVAAGRVCLPVYDAALRATSVRSVVNADMRTVVSGIWNAQCLAVDDKAFYVDANDGRAGGLARIAY